MKKHGLDRWLRRLRGTATLVYIAALCGAVALLVIGFIPGSPVRLELPTSLLSGLDQVGGIGSGVVVDPSGALAVRVSDPSLGQRMLYLAITLPGLVLLAVIARRMANLLRATQDSDPFTEQTAHELTALAKITAIGGLAVWAIGTASAWGLSATMLQTGTAVGPHQSPLGWFAVGLIFAGFALLIGRGVAMRAELDTVI
jgi:hypothetical protein